MPKFQKTKVIIPLAIFVLAVAGIWFWFSQPKPADVSAEINNSGNSIVKGQSVLMADGTQKNIEDVKVGDEVISYNPDTKITEKDKVTDVLKGSHSEYLVFNNTLKTSLDHVIFANNKFVPAQDIKVGDFLLNSQGSNVKVFKIDHIYKNVETYDLTVEKNHDFFLNGVLVHNGTGTTTNTLVQGNWKIYYDDGAEPVTPYANENTGATLSSNSSIVRIRVDLLQALAGRTLTNLKIQYSTDNTNFTDMGAGNAWNWANGQGADGSAVTTFKLSDTTTYLNYIESVQGSTVATNSLNEFDFAITPTATVSTSTLYYFRFFEGTLSINLGSGKTHPQITTAAVDVTPPNRLHPKPN